MADQSLRLKRRARLGLANYEETDENYNNDNYDFDHLDVSDHSDNRQYNSTMSKNRSSMLHEQENIHISTASIQPRSRSLLNKNHDGHKLQIISKIPDEIQLPDEILRKTAQFSLPRRNHSNSLPIISHRRGSAVSVNEYEMELKALKSKNTQRNNLQISPPLRPPSAVERAWVKTKEKNTSRQFPTTNKEPFDLYIDAIRFVPDNIRICKVVCQLFNSDLSNEVGRKTAFPSLDSYQRCPTFRLKISINHDREDANPTMVFMFRAYGYQRTSSSVVVLGCCLFEPFKLSKRTTQLKVGGHQIRMRHGLPNLKEGVRNMDESDLNDQNAIPGCTLLIRLLPASQAIVSVPRYEDGYYNTQAAEPTETESRIYQQYMALKGFRHTTVADELHDIQKEFSQNISRDKAKLKELMVKILDHKKPQIKYKKPVPYMEYSHFINYNESSGMNICIRGLANIPEKFHGLYIQALAEVRLSKSYRVFLGDRANDLRIFTKHLDIKSSINSPEWLDEAKKIYPPYDESAYLLIQIYGIKAQHKTVEQESPNNDSKDSNSRRGSRRRSSRSSRFRNNKVLHVEKDEDFGTDYKNPLLWAVMPLFYRGFLQAGLHSIAVFRDPPSLQTLVRLEKEKKFNETLLKCIERGECQKPEDECIMEVEIWDGHVEFDDIPESDNQSQLDIFGIKEDDNDDLQRRHNYNFYQILFTNGSKSKHSHDQKIDREVHRFCQEANKYLYSLLIDSMEENGELPLKI